MFVFSKFFWAVMQPGNLLLLMLIAGCLLALAGRRRFGGALIGLSVVALTIVAVLPVGAWLLAPLENRFPQPAELPPAGEVDGVIVLGGFVDPILAAERDAPALTASAERLTGFAALVRRYPDAVHIFTGGSGVVFGQELKEADVVRALMPSVGIAPESILWERASRNTYENAVLSAALADVSAGETWILVTSAAHMPRSVGVFRQAGWPVIPYPVDYQTGSDIPPVPTFDLEAGLITLNGAAREWLGLAAYWLMGRTDALFPAPESPSP